MAKAADNQATTAEPQLRKVTELKKGAGWKSLRHPFWEVEKGAYIAGEVVAKHFGVKGKFGKRDMLDIRLSEPARVRLGKNKETKQVEHKNLPEGAVARVEVRAAMGSLATMVNEGDQVQILCTGKVPTDKGNDAWTFETSFMSLDKSHLEDDDDDGSDD